MNLPEPKNIKWAESSWDFGRMHGLSIRVGSLTQGVRTPAVSGEPVLPLFEAKNVLLKWFWRKLGAI